MTKTLTRKGLEDLLLGTNRGNTFISIVAKTKPKFKGGKSSPYTDRVLKINKAMGIANFNYEDGINRRLVKEGTSPDFKAGDATYQIVTNNNNMTPLVENKKDPSKKYLRMQVQKYESPEFVEVSTGKAISKDLLKDHLYIPSDSGRGQGLQTPLDIKTYSLESIAQINIGGDSYEVED